MRITESRLRSVIRSILKENDEWDEWDVDVLPTNEPKRREKENTMGLGDVSGSIEVRGLNVDYKLVDYGECELTFTVENSSGRDLLENLIRAEAKNCGLKPNMYGSSQSIKFSISDMTEARKCLDQILEYFEVLNQRTF